MHIQASEMPLQADGSVYHLGLEPEDLASKVILVGDPGRVSLVSSFFDSVEVRKQNRELHTHTGMYKGKRLSVISTGMGTDNLDIVVNELDALVNIDLSKRCIKSTHQSLELIRLGTCGALQGNIDIHTPIASRYGFGLDGLLHYYRHEAISDEVLVDAFVAHCGWDAKHPRPYAVGCATALLDRLAHDCLQGITLTATGFYGPQSRVLRLPLAGEDFIETLQGFQYRHLYFTNLEMETSALYALSRLLGHQALSICIAIANRVTGRFSQGYHSAMEDMVIKVLERI
jgi:uridine phosphorylase